MRSSRFAVLLLLLPLMMAESQEPLTFAITGVAPDVPIPPALLTSLTTSIKSRGGIVDHQHADYTLYLNVSPATDGSLLLSVTAGRAMPDALIRQARSSQIMYAGVDPAKLPREGAFVREQLSEEFARGFVQPVWGRLSHLKETEMSAGVDRLIGEFFERFAQH